MPCAAINRFAFSIRRPRSAASIGTLFPARGPAGFSCRGEGVAPDGGVPGDVGPAAAVPASAGVIPERNPAPIVVVMKSLLRIIPVPLMM